jgi:hypothetical protein
MSFPKNMVFANDDKGTGHIAYRQDVLLLYVEFKSKGVKVL